MTEHARRRLEIALFVIILIAGAALRLVALESVPPGPTYEEAARSAEASRLLQSETPISLTENGSRAPLFRYATSMVMLVVGRTLLSSRLTAALFGISLLILTYAWVRVATHNRWLALAAMAMMAVNFWAVLTSRHVPRSETLPALFMAAALAMRRGIVVEEDPDQPQTRPAAVIDRYTWFVAAGVFIGLSMYAHLAARVMWLVFPLFFIFLSLTQPGVIRKVWPGLLVMLVIAFVVATPLFVDAAQHPPDDIHVESLDSLREDLRAALRMITIRGDQNWLNNIPGRPMLGPISSLLFYLGLSVAVVSIFFPYRPVRRGLRTSDEAFRISSANAFMLITLAVGIVPTLITGTGASSAMMTGIQPALYYMPALAVVWLADWSNRQAGSEGNRAIWVSYGVLVIVIGLITISGYFGLWNNAPQVRAAYHETTVQILNYLDQHPELGPDISISTAYPAEMQDPAIVPLVLRRRDLRIRWFDGQSTLILPAGGQAAYFTTNAASLNHLLHPYLDHPAPLPTVPRALSHLADSFQLSSASPFQAVVPAALFRDGLAYLSSELPTTTVHSGGTLSILTFWRITDLGDGALKLLMRGFDSQHRIAAESISAPIYSSHWATGDVIIQLFTATLPADLPAGPLDLSVGALSLPASTPLAVSSDTLPMQDQMLVIGTIEVVAP